MSDNYFRIIMLIVFILVYIFDYIRIMFRESFLKEFNPARPVSRAILASLVLALVTMIPALVYQIFQVTGINIPWMGDFVTITNTITGISQLLLVGFVIHWRFKG